MQVETKECESRTSDLNGLVAQLSVHFLNQVGRPLLDTPVHCNRGLIVGIQRLPETPLIPHPQHLTTALPSLW